MKYKNYNMEWSTHFKLDKASPSGLLQIKNKVGKDIEGCTAGFKHFRTNGEPHAWLLNFQCKTYSVHRIIWVLFHGDISDELLVDHLDGDPFNNEIDNLRLKTAANNLRNRRQQSNNTSNITGVYASKTKADYRYYTVQWCELNGKRKVKCFSIDKLGEETAKELAISYREEQIKRLIAEGADYTERHGL